MPLCVDIKKKLGDFCLDVSFQAENVIMALLGASGCGKSMTLKCIAGIETPDSGRITLDGRVLFDSEKHINLAPQKRKVGYLFQQFALFPNMTVEQNIMTGIQDKDRRHELAAEKIKAFRLEGLEKLKPHQLSGGQQQRTALARIIASEPEAILLDEPFSSLDSYLKWQLEMEISDFLADFPGPVIWVSHDRNEVYRNCPAVCVLKDGKSEPAMKMQKLFETPGTVGAATISGCKNFARIENHGKCGKVFVPDWNMDIAVSGEVKAATHIGIRARYIRPAAERDENTLDCRVERITHDVFSTLLMLSPVCAKDGAPSIRMETDKETGGHYRKGDIIKVSFRPDDVLLLFEENHAGVADKQ